MSEYVDTDFTDVIDSLVDGWTELAATSEALKDTQVRESVDPAAESGKMLVVAATGALIDMDPVETTTSRPRNALSRRRTQYVRVNCLAHSFSGDRGARAIRQHRDRARDMFRAVDQWVMANPKFGNPKLNNGHIVSHSYRAATIKEGCGAQIEFVVQATIL